MRLEYENERNEEWQRLQGNIKEAKVFASYKRLTLPMTNEQIERIIEHMVVKAGE